jgi:hypothetical protein
MTLTDFFCLLPFLIIAGAPLIMMLTIAVKRNYEVIFGFTVIAFLAAILSVVVVLAFVPHIISPLFIFDRFGLFPRLSETAIRAEGGILYYTFCGGVWCISLSGSHAFCFLFPGDRNA